MGHEDHVTPARQVRLQRRDDLLPQPTEAVLDPASQAFDVRAQVLRTEGGLADVEIKVIDQVCRIVQRPQAAELEPSLGRDERE